MKKTILISGKMGSGKSTLASNLADHLNIHGFTVYKIKFADPLYKMHDAVLAVLAEYGIERPLDKTLLQILGTAWGRETIDQELWVNLLKFRIASLPKDAIAIIDDCRFENEFNAFGDECLKVRLDCPREVRKLRCSQWRDNEVHPSEIGLDSYADAGKFDMYLDTSDKSPEQHVLSIFARVTSCS